MSRALVLYVHASRLPDFFNHPLLFVEPQVFVELCPVPLRAQQPGFEILRVLCLSLFAEHLHLHTLLEEGERLCEVADRKVVLYIAAHLFHLEVEPLLVAFGVCVHFAEKIVFLGPPDSAFLHVKVAFEQRVGLHSFEVAALYCGIKVEIVRLELVLLSLFLLQVVVERL